MSAPTSHLQTELDHALGESLLADAMLKWRPTNKTQQSNLLEETLSHARVLSNVLANVCEHRAVTLDLGGGEDIVDAADTWGLADLLSTLLEIVTLVSRQTCPEHTDEPESTTDRLWLSGGDGNGHWVDAQIKQSPTPADPDAVNVVLRNGLLHPDGCQRDGDCTR